MRRKRPSGYLAQGYTMSLRGRIAILHDEYPIGYFMHLFGLSQSISESLVIYMGVHHTTSYYELTKFYRLPDKDDPDELMKIYNAFHSVGANHVKFIEVMSHHLQKRIDEKNKVLPKNERPRKRSKRKRYARGRRRRGIRKKSSLNRKNW